MLKSFLAHGPKLLDLSPYIIIIRVTKQWKGFVDLLLIDYRLIFIFATEELYNFPDQNNLAF